MADKQIREIQLIIKVSDDVLAKRTWRTAWKSAILREDSAPADIIAALDGAVTKLETMTGLH